MQPIYNSNSKNSQAYTPVIPDNFSFLIREFLKEEKSSLLSKTKHIFNNFSVQEESPGQFKITCFNKSYVMHFIEAHAEKFSQLKTYQDIMNILKEPQTLSEVNHVINTCYFDILVFQLLNLETQNSWFHKIPLVQKIRDKKFNRAKIFELNKSSITMDSSTSNPHYKKIVNLGFDFIEMPSDFKLSQLSQLTTSISDLVHEKKLLNFSVNLRIKKLGLYRSYGFYSRETNTIFLDPRHCFKVWRHELGHYVYYKNKISGIDEENFSDNF